MEKGRQAMDGGVIGDNRPRTMSNGVLENHGVPATERLAGPVVGAPARRLPPGKIVASVAYAKLGINPVQRKELCTMKYKH